jgi:drug/metabolite transporter (DMT)-like permease
VVIQPGFQEVNLGVIFILGSAFLFAGVNLIVKRLSAREKPEVIVFYMGALMTPLSLGPALLVWVTPSWESIGWCVLIAAFANLGHLVHTRAFSLADASAVLPFDFARLPFVAFLAYVFFAEAPTAGTWLGGLLIFGSTVYIAHREAQAARVDRLEQAATQAEATRAEATRAEVSPAGEPRDGRGRREDG